LKSDMETSEKAALKKKADKLKKAHEEKEKKEEEAKAAEAIENANDDAPVAEATNEETSVE